MSSGLASLAQNSDPAWEFAPFKLLAYNSSKTALNALTVQLAADLKSTPIKVNAADPGYTATDMNQNQGTRTSSRGPGRLSAWPHCHRTARLAATSTRKARSRGERIDNPNCPVRVGGCRLRLSGGGRGASAPAVRRCPHRRSATVEDTSQSEPEDPRVRLAGERTLLAWIRTGLALMGFGFVVARFGLFLGRWRPPGRRGARLHRGVPVDRDRPGSPRSGGEPAGGGRAPPLPPRPRSEATLPATRWSLAWWCLSCSRPSDW